MIDFRHPPVGLHVDLSYKHEKAVKRETICVERNSANDEVGLTADFPIGVRLSLILICVCRR